MHTYRTGYILGNMEVDLLDLLFLKFLSKYTPILEPED